MLPSRIRCTILEGLGLHKNSSPYFPLQERLTGYEGKGARSSRLRVALIGASHLDRCGRAIDRRRSRGVHADSTAHACPWEGRRLARGCRLTDNGDVDGLEIGQLT